MQNEVDKILYKMGYYGCDPQKKQEVQDSIDAATEFMREGGVPEEKLKCARAYSVKALWADGIDKGLTIYQIVKPDGMVCALIAQIRD